MGSIEVHAGDFHGYGAVGGGSIVLTPPENKLFGVPIPLSELASVELASEEAVKRLGGTIGWGLAGAALLGPAGLLAGLLLGGKSKKVTFVARFKDGRKLLASTDPATFRQLQAAAF